MIEPYTEHSRKRLVSRLNCLGVLTRSSLRIHAVCPRAYILLGRGCARGRTIASGATIEQIESGATWRTIEKASQSGDGFWRTIENRNNSGIGGDRR